MERRKRNLQDTTVYADDYDFITKIDGKRDRIMK